MSLLGDERPRRPLALPEALLAPSDLARCLTAMLWALDWSGGADDLLAALPHAKPEIDLTDLRNTLAVLGYPTRLERLRRGGLDPRLLPRLQGRRVLLVDDVISTGSSAHAGLALLGKAGVRPVGLCVAMAQGDRWRVEWPRDVPVAAAFATPLFRRVDGGWMPDEATRPAIRLPLREAV